MAILKPLDAVKADVSHRWGIFGNAVEIVDEKFTTGLGYASAAILQAQDTVAELLRIASQLNNIDVDVVIPDITPPSVDSFVGVAPTAPRVQFNMPDEIDEADDVFNAVHDKVLRDIQDGAPAIPEVIRIAIQAREQERSFLLHNENIDRIASEWSKRGFTLPDGMLASLIAQADIDYANKRLDISRDLAIKEYELSDTNTKFAIQQGLIYYAQRVEVYKTKVQAEIARIDATVKAYLGEVEVYKGSAQVYTSLVDTKIKVYDSQIRAALMTAELVIKDAEIDMKNFEMMNTLRIEAMKAIGAINAQVAAGALSSVSASAQISASNAANYAYSAPATIAKTVRDEVTGEVYGLNY